MTEYKKSRHTGTYLYIHRREKEIIGQSNRLEMFQEKKWRSFSLFLGNFWNAESEFQMASKRKLQLTSNFFQFFAKEA